MSAGVLDHARESLRLQQTYSVLLYHAWDFALGRWPTINAFRHRMQSWIWHLPPEVDLETVSTPAKVRILLEELGPTYVKMGQIVSSQSSVVPVEWNVELAKLQSNVPTFPPEQVRAIIIEELGRPPEEIYATFAPEPFAAASTAQVHRATLHDGSEVVVKVQRPGIRTQMRADIGIMRNATNVLAQRSQAVRAVDLPGMVEQFGSSVLAELDYMGEAYNAHVLSRNLAGLEGVQVPKVYYELCTSKVLTMEFISGVKINKIGTIQAAGLDRPRLARNAMRAVIKMLLIDGFFHADPHPGNVLVNPETGMITLLDTGMVGHLDLQNRITLIQLILAFKNRDINAMGLLLLDLSTPFMEPVDEEGYLREFERTVNQYMLLGGPGLGFGPVVSDSLELLRKYGLRLDPDLTMAIKALMQVEAISALLYPEGGIVNEGAQMIRELAVQEITADRVVEVAKKQITLTARQALRQLPSLQSAAMSWLTQFRRGRFEVHVDSSGLGQEISRLNRVGRIAVIGILLAGMLIASSNATAFLAQVQQEGDIWSIIGRVAYLGYLFSMMAAVIIVAKLIWDWWHKKDDI